MISRMVKGIPFDKEQLLNTLSRKRRLVSTFLDAKDLQRPTIKMFRFEGAAEKPKSQRHMAFGKYKKL